MVSSGVSANRLELLQVAEAVAREKQIDKDVVVAAMEEAIQKAARSRYGAEHKIIAEIDRQTGETRLFRAFDVVEEVEDEATEMTLADARHSDPEVEIGGEIREPLPPIDFGRIAAQTAKQVIMQKVRDAERERQFEEYQDKVGQVINGVVKRVEYGNVIVDLGRAEAIVRREQVIPREQFKTGDRIRAYIYDVRRETRGPQIFLSHTRPEFMGKLFEQEVPEIYDGVIEIKAVARDPGSRAKIAVQSHDSGVDPVGACVGMRGSRVQAVVGELQGEKVDIIQWSPVPATFIVSALAPADVVKVVMDEDDRRIEVVVPDDQLSLAIGRRGQNVRLASQLTGWEIDILTEDEESQRRQDEFRQRSELFTNALDVEETIAQLLVAEGFTSLEEVAYVELDELSSIEGFDEEIGEELQARAVAALEAADAALVEQATELGVEDGVRAIDGLTPAMMVTLGEAGIKTLDDLGDLASDELIDRKDGILKAYNLGEDEANAIIMAARAHWFEDEETPEAPETAEEAAAPAEDQA